MQIVKRNGELQEFNPEKIEKVISKALSETKEQGNAKELSEIVCKAIREGMTVEQIQDLVFDTLVKNNLVITAREFERYRTRRTVLREQKLEKTYADMDKILKQGSDENSNKDSQLLNVKRDLLAGEFYRNRLLQILPKHLAKAHSMKIIHIHDSDFDTRSTNCSIPNVKDMLENGFKNSNAYIGTPKSVQVASTVLMQIVFSVSNSQYGGTSISDFNELLSIYAKKNFRKNFIDVYRLINNVSNSSLDECILELEDNYGKIDSGNKELEKIYEREFTEAKNKTDKDIYDACQTFEYQCNSLQNANQVPFVTITMAIPTSWESERVISNYFKVRQKGLTDGKKTAIAIFPKISMYVVDGYNLKEGDKYYYLLKEASKCIAQTYYPDLLMYSKSDYDNNKYYARMGCRSRVNHEYKENGKYVKYGRANFGVTTLNLPHLCLETLKEKGDINTLLNRINDISQTLMKDAFIFRFSQVKTLKPKEVPILFMAGGLARLNENNSIEPLLRSDKFSLSYGYLGIDDCVRLLTDNKENISTDKGYELGMKIMNCLVDNVNKLKKEINLPISLYSTPKLCGWL